MKAVCIITGFALTLTMAQAQSISLTDFLIFPRLDSANWYSDLERINSSYRAASPCETCFTTRKDSVEHKICIQTAFGHARLDTLFNNAAKETLQGRWYVVKAGTFEVIDSTSSAMKGFVRSIHVRDDQKTPGGFVEFTDSKVHIDLTTSHGRQRDRGRYSIQNKQFMVAKKFIGRACSPTIIGITANGLLVMDILGYGTDLSYSKHHRYFVFRTRITRIILRRDAQPTVSRSS